ncbi:MAG: PilC/PilY family type IV pilus protein, partial [Desulfobacterales bacterium]
STLDALQIVDFNYGNHAYNPGWPGAWVVNRPMNDGEFADWGNPVAEMMYESLRYFAGLSSPTGAFSYSGGFDDTLGLPQPAWIDPFDPDNGGFQYCASPFMLVLSDINPTYDSDSLPGSAFASFSGDTLGGMNVASLADTIFANEFASGNYFIGQSGTGTGSYDGACTEKSVSGFGDVRGLCPEEPTKEGSYYAASVAYHGLIDPGRGDDPNTDEDETNKRDIHGTAQNSQQVLTYAVGLASPLPRIEVDLPGGLVTLVPFGKSVGDNCGGFDVPTAEGQFQPTNTIVDFFVQEIVRDAGGNLISARFRINYEDVEQAADHDMDAIVLYDIQMVDSNGAPVSDRSQAVAVEVTLTSEYAAGCIHQHLGYVISGSTADGTSLEVRDGDESGNNDYFLDTPDAVGASGDPGYNDGAPLPLQHTRTFTPSGTGTAAQLLPNPLYYAAKWGGFEDTNKDGIPNSGPNPGDNLEWDKDSDGLPDTYFYVTNPLKLEEQLNASFAAILRRTSSGTAASVISGTRSGEGAIYQSIFYPQYTGQQGNAVKWIGQIHGLLVDAWGNMREDTNGNEQLDMVADYIIRFDGSNVNKHADSNGDGLVAGSELTPVESGSVLDIDYLWSSSEYLNTISDTWVVSQRTYGNATQPGRHIITFVDEDGDMIVDPNELVDFAAPSLPTPSQLSDAGTLFPYIPVSADSSALPSFVDGSNRDEFLQIQTQRVINFIRGADQGEHLLTSGTAATIPAFRSRRLDADGDGTLETWRMGDIVYSSPTAVGRPAEALHLLYQDPSYGAFIAQYDQRRNVIYVGGNDGMLHAFNGGFFEDRHDLNGDSEDDVAYLRQPMDQDGNVDSSYAAFDLGAELWAYVPHNLLPHLYWLTEESYPHVYYMDLKPKVFDAKIFPADSDHPHGWGTLLVAGMRFGGGLIDVDMDRTDGTVDSPDRTMGSAYVIMDITNPEVAPKVLAEVRFPRLGYTTSYPTGLFMKNRDATLDNNEWYLAFGSGPADFSGQPGTNAGNALPNAISEQSAYLYVINLNSLTSGSGAVVPVTSGASAGFGDVNAFAELDSNAFISDPVAVDFDFDYATDVVYFGTVSGDEANGWGGKMRRLVVDDDPNPANWVGDSVLLDVTPLQQPLTAAATPAIDNLSRRWVFFGSGRYLTRNDTQNVDQQSYYGVREPVDGSQNATWAQVDVADLLDHSNVEVDVDGTISGASYATWGAFESNLLNDPDYDGWFVDFDEIGERNLGQAALLGGLLTFTTFVPDDDICAFEGTSSLYALYYKSGTAYKKPAIGSEGQTDGVDNDGDGSTDEAGEEGGRIFTKTSLGRGLALTPNLHV